MEQDEIEDLLEEYSRWLHKNGYIDADYYTEEPHTIDAFIAFRNKHNENKSKTNNKKLRNRGEAH